MRYENGVVIEEDRSGPEGGLIGYVYVSAAELTEMFGGGPRRISRQTNGWCVKLNGLSIHFYADPDLPDGRTWRIGAAGHPFALSVVKQLFPEAEVRGASRA
jgi:hypothetical protein